MAKSCRLKSKRMEVMEEVALKIHPQLVAVSFSPDVNQTDHIERKKK